MDLQRVLKRYPRRSALRDGTSVVLRPLIPEDEEQLVGLFKDISYEELRNLRDDVADPSVVRRWCRRLDYDRVLPIVAVTDGAIIADATLHRRRVDPRRDVGRLRAYVHPYYRGRGLGAVLLAELIEIAHLVGLTQVAVELFEDQHALIRMFQRYGFRIEGHMPVYQTVVLIRDVALPEQTTA
jgi:GNAT superfamily N-acetyltransferase